MVKQGSKGREAGRTGKGSRGTISEDFPKSELIPYFLKKNHRTLRRKQGGGGGSHFSWKRRKLRQTIFNSENLRGGGISNGRESYYQVPRRGGMWRKLEEADTLQRVGGGERHIKTEGCSSIGENKRGKGKLRINSLRRRHANPGRQRNWKERVKLY